MRIAEYKQVSSRTEQRVIHHDDVWDDNGNIIARAWDETVEVQVPVMGMAYRDATPEEIAKMERAQAEMPAPVPTMEERMTVLETQVSSLMTDEGAEVAMGILNGTIKEETANANANS